MSALIKSVGIHREGKEDERGVVVLEIQYEDGTYVELGREREGDNFSHWWTIQEKATLDWDAAKKHFDAVREQYQELEGTPGVNTTIALRMVFDPLHVRYNNGERTKALHDEMMGVE